MDAWSGAIGLPLFGAVLHPLLGLLVQRATKLGVRPTVILGFANLMTLAIFSVYLRPDFSAEFSFMDVLAVISGLCFFGGQWFAVQAVRNGDLVVNSSAMGSKVLMVAVLSASVGLEKAGIGLIAGALLAAAAVYLVTGATAERWKANRVTLWLTLGACVFFAFADFMVGWKSRETGAARWLIIMMGTAGVVSVFMLIPRWEQVKRVISERSTALPVLGAGLLMGMQALVVNMAFSIFGEPTLSNIAYSTRGVMAVFIVWAIMNRGRSGIGGRQLAGAALMVLALAVALM
ncbi:MAG: hypothetical protein NWS80_10850 [Akkermansiaceae bacterium]|jgi:hypothetical protein|nr:hypothetical protein [Akkermansiaceae bacterium]MDP4995611.1 hypothetical protein [Akkermansiaceae bacterium]